MGYLFSDTNSSVDIYFKNNSKVQVIIIDFGDGNFSQTKTTSNTYTIPGNYIVQLVAKNDSIGTCTNSMGKTIEIIVKYWIIIVKLM